MDPRPVPSPTQPTHVAGKQGPFDLHSRHACIPCHCPRGSAAIRLTRPARLS